MYASKEKARRAYKEAARLFEEVGTGQEDEIKFVLDFLTAAERKLPTEASYRRAENKPQKRTKLANG